MRTTTALALASILVAWSNGALAQASNIELLDVNTVARIQHPPSTSSVGPAPGESSLRSASREHLREGRLQQGRSRDGVKATSVFASLGRRSEMAEHRQERRGAPAGKAGGKGNGQS